MTKKFNSEQLRREIVDAIIRLASSIPLYSIRLEDIANEINRKFKLKDKEAYRTGSIMAALDSAMDSTLEKIDPVIASQFHELADDLKRTNQIQEGAKRSGRYRRTSVYILILALELIWDSLSPMTGIFKHRTHPLLKLQMVVTYLLSFLFSEENPSKKDKESIEGIKRIFIAESFMPIGVKKRITKNKEQWVEPINPWLVNFINLLDQLIEELQQKHLFSNDLNAQAIRQIVLGAIMWSALGKIWQEGSNLNFLRQKKYFTADYNLEQANKVIKKMLYSFCTEEGKKEFMRVWIDNY